MRYRTLGRTGLQVSEISMGGLFLGHESHETGVAVVQRALELGINFFDTAPSYIFPKSSQAVLGEALEGVSTPHYVSSKIGPHPLFPDPTYDYDSIMQQVEFNLKELRRGTIDILHIHDPDRYGDRNNPGNYHAVFGKGMALETLQKLREQQVIRFIGLGSLWMDYQAHCIDTGAFDVVLTFNRYGLIWRDAQFQTFPFCKRHQVGVMQGTPMHQGVLAVPRPEWVQDPPEWMTATEHDRYRRLLAIQARSGLPLPELALRFILQHPTISAVIPGAANVAQLEANVAAVAAGPLPDDLTADIEALGILHDDPRRYI
jgi:aryl-alcohol dehydrogenase-like predicted oxidoreductase